MRTLFLYWMILLILLFTLTPVQAQTVDLDSSHLNGLVISYQVSFSQKNKKTSISETYNGGNQTLFISGNKARLRLVSLMRIESLFFLPGEDSVITVYQVKESGRKNIREKMTVQEWKERNKKYDSIRVELNETGGKKIAGYSCNKAMVQLADGRSITAYYTPELPTLPALYQPAFAGLPGLVLEYSYSYEAGRITYTATAVRQEQISPGIFLLQGNPLPSLQF